MQNRQFRSRLGAQDSDQREPAAGGLPFSPQHRLNQDAPVAETPAPPAVIVYAGCTIRYMGRLWTVERVNQHSGHGPLIAISSVEDDTFELICGKGCDGPFEVVAW